MREGEKEIEEKETQGGSDRIKKFEIQSTKKGMR